MIKSTKSQQLHLHSITDSKDMNLSKSWERVKNREACCVAVHGVTKSRTWLSDWTELKCVPKAVQMSYPVLRLLHTSAGLRE